MTAENTLILLVRYGWTPTAGTVLPGWPRGLNPAPKRLSGLRSA